MRIPSNVPYVVDNLWEWLRPEDMPSRRHAIYASPTPELALANASAALAPGEIYVACRVIVAPAHIRVAQLAVRDAREHPDIRTVSRWVSSHRQSLIELGPINKQQANPLLTAIRCKTPEEMSLVNTLCKLIDAGTSGQSVIE